MTVKLTHISVSQRARIYFLPYKCNTMTCPAGVTTVDGSNTESIPGQSAFLKRFNFPMAD